jgi:hypothetical protein
LVELLWLLGSLNGGEHMLLLLAIVLAIAWVFGFTVFHVASAGIHVLIVLAIVAAVAHLVGRRRLT